MNTKNKTGRITAWLIPVLAIVVGAGVGAATAITKYQEPIMTLPGHEATATAAAPPIADAKPRVHVPGPLSYNFGVMGRNEEQSHTFQVQNIGNGPLTLKVLDTTCKCTVGSLEKDTIQAGETVDVTMTWETRSYDREFRQSATIETNDMSQREIIFSVEGKVLQLAMPDLPRMKFARVSRSEPQSFETTVYAYRDKDLVITGHDFSDPDIAEFFTVTTEPVAEDQWATVDATAAIRVRIDIHTGLPIGANRQIISLRTNKVDIAPMDVAVELTVVSDISVLGGRNFNDETNILAFGPVPAGEDVQLHLMVKGKYKDQVDFAVMEIDPEESLAAEIGEPSDISGGKSRRFPLKLIVKPTSPPIQRMGSEQGPLGRVVFSTNHPEIETFEIKVQFAVQ